MAIDTEIAKPGSMTGSIAANFHEGSRSEYLAQFVFSSFGTAIPVPHQEDSGIDLYCTLIDRIGQRAWPRAYYSVQVKSTMAPWVFDGAESVRWIIEYPLPIFLCVVEKRNASVSVYHTTPRFAAWASPTHPKRLELIPGLKTKSSTVEWLGSDTYKLEAPILKFTIQEMLDDKCRQQIVEVLQFWIDFDLDNLHRIKSGIRRFRVPYNYETNTTKHQGLMELGTRFQEKSLPVVQDWIKELLNIVATHEYESGRLVPAAIYAMALRQMFPKYGSFEPHNTFLHSELNRRFRMEPPTYLYQACDSLLQIVKDELVRHGIADPTPLPLE